MFSRNCAVSVVLALFSVPVSSAARQADVAVFSRTTSSEFTLLEPGKEQGSPVDAGADLPLKEFHPDLLGAFKDMSDVGIQSEVSSGPAQRPTDGLFIPAWMGGSPALRRPTDFNPRLACSDLIYAPHPSLTAEQEARRKQYFVAMAAAACGEGVPVALFDALIIQESRYNPMARSIKGASGLTQLMPGTANGLGVVDRWSVRENLEGGARYLRNQLDKFGDWSLALAAYNAGPGNVEKYGGIPPFAETRDYVRRIMANVSIVGSAHAAARQRPVRSVTLASFGP